MLVIKIAVFLVALGLGIEAASFAKYYATTLEEDLNASRPLNSTGHLDGHPKKGSLANGHRMGSGSSGFNPNAEPLRKGNLTTPLRIIAKKKADYTEVARNNSTEGTVTLRVTFLASGGIGAITVIKSLPDGLTENAIAAARYIEFDPEYKDGVPRTTTRPVSYTFNIY